MSDTTLFRSACPVCRQPRLSRDLIDRAAAPTAEFVCVNSECTEFGIYRRRPEVAGTSSR